MTPDARAALHARCFAEGAPASWPAAAFAELLARQECFVLDAAGGFALGRAVAGEAELLTLAVAPEARRRGTGRALVAAFEAEARARGATAAFLEVADTNAAARALYAGAGWRPAGRRRGYFAAPGRPAADAIVLRKSLRVPWLKA
jgi:ribosomal-protein-alanine N-acetyltransferase